MSASCCARFWLSACCAALMPTAIGHQDLAALVGHQRGADAGWHLIASPFGTIEAATFRYTRPVGSAVAVPLLRTVNFDPRSLDAQAWKIDEPLTARHARQIEYPAVNRVRKGDRLPAASAAPASVDPASLPQLQPIDAPAPPQPNERHVDAGADDDLILLDKPPQIPQSGAADEARSSLEAMSFLDDEAGDRSTQIYFGTGVMGSPAALQSWAPGAAPILVPPSDESGIKLSALEGADYGAEQGGETVAGKDDATRQQSPAQQLGLTGKARAHAEKCLADAVYFEARGEPLKGQQAVAQVVINRVFSGFYPHDVCGVVYQNANRHLACQFTFACEGKDLSRIDEPDMWEQAKRIAKDTLDGKIWLADIGHATHYHAYWVHPSWVHEMVRLYKFGVHTFYRPRNWGDGEDDWGPTQINSETMRPDPEVMTENPVPMPKPEAAKGSQASASPATDRGTATAKL